MIEYACYVGNYYGTPEGICTGTAGKRKRCDIEIEIQGAAED